MATVDRDQALALPGRLYSGVTATTGSAPYGGTALGLTARCVFSEGEEGGRLIRCHGFGGAPVGRVRGTEFWRLSVFFRSYDADAFTAAFPDLFTASSRQGRRPALQGGGQLVTGASLLFFPEPDADYTLLPGVLFYYAVPEGAPAQHKLADWPNELTWAVSFLAVAHPTTGRYTELAPPANMTAP